MWPSHICLGYIPLAALFSWQFFCFIKLFHQTEATLRFEDILLIHIHCTAIAWSAETLLAILKSESVPLVLLFWQPASFQHAAQGKSRHTHSPLLPVAARAPLSHTASPADTIHQRPPKSNAANWKVMTAKGLLDLHANSSILASHSQATGKMRLSASFQTISCLLFHSTQAHIPIYFLLALLSWSQKSAGDCITCAFQKSQPRTARGNMFLSSHWDRAADCSCRWAFKHQSSTTDDCRAEHFPQAGLQLPCAFYASAYNGFSALVSCRIVELCFEYPTSTTVLPLASALAPSLPIISFKCQQHTRHTEI